MERTLPPISIVERGSFDKYLYLICLMIRSCKRRTRRNKGYRMRERSSNQGYGIILVLLDGQVGMIRNNVLWEYRRRCSIRGSFAGGLESIAELICMTLISVIMFRAIGALVTLLRFGFLRSRRVGLLGVLLLVVGFVDLMGVSGKSVAIRGEVSRTRMLKKTTANINISKRVLRVEVGNYIIHRRGKRCEQMPCFSFIGL